jgi:phosphoribosyl 1,2-cyclic phosphodiesterase
MAVTFCPLASGSSGNSVYIATQSAKILIDAGLSGKNIEAALRDISVDAADIDAVFITHEHTDHIRGAGILSRRFDIPLYATENTWRRAEMLGNIAPRNKKTVYEYEKCFLNDMTLLPFPIPHDAAQPVGYAVFAQGRKLSIATDIGRETDDIKESIADSDLILLESNHDIDMLLNGPYPPALKRRVMGERGHLSNVSAGRLLADIMSSRLKTVFLGHLSEENNLPLVAVDTVARILEAEKIGVGSCLKLALAQRERVSEAVTLPELI